MSSTAVATSGTPDVPPGTTSSKPWDNASLIDPNPPMSEAEKKARASLTTKLDPNNPLAASGFDGMTVIFMTLRLLTKIVDSLSASAIVRADNVNNNLITQQNRYGDIMNAVKLFIKGSGSRNIDGSNKDRADQQSKNRDDMNRILSAFTQKEQMNRSVVTDQIKIEQTKMQSKDDTISQIKSLFNKYMTDLGDMLRSLF
jgi:hypothetical protein